MVFIMGPGPGGAISLFVSFQPHNLNSKRTNETTKDIKKDKKGEILRIKRT